MSTDYIMFIHGVNTRDVREQPTYAKKLIELIQKSKNVNFIPIPLYWGDVNARAETELIVTLKQSELWEQMWFREFREKQLLQFAGDAALYISRFLGANVVKRLKEDAFSGLSNFQPNDRLHLVTHSWGTVILFDILFAARWDAEDIPGHQDVMEIRDIIFGISGIRDPLYGIELASIHTMGSPIAIFSLIDVKQGKDESQTSPSQHDITPRLQKLLMHLHEKRDGMKLPWKNFIHPGDPIAYPLKELIISLVDGESRFLDIQDLMIHDSGLSEFFTEPFSQTTLALLHGGDAHGSYWSSNKVAQEIIKSLT